MTTKQDPDNNTVIVANNPKYWQYNASRIFLDNTFEDLNEIENQPNNLRIDNTSTDIVLNVDNDDKKIKLDGNSEITRSLIVQDELSCNTIITNKIDSNFIKVNTLEPKDGLTITVPVEYTLEVFGTIIYGTSAAVHNLADSNVEDSRIWNTTIGYDTNGNIASNKAIFTDVSMNNLIIQNSSTIANKLDVSCVEVSNNFIVQNNIIIDNILNVGNNILIENVDYDDDDFIEPSLNYIAYGFNGFDKKHILITNGEYSFKNGGDDPLINTFLFIRFEFDTPDLSYNLDISYNDNNKFINGVDGDLWEDASNNIWLKFDQNNDDIIFNVKGDFGYLLIF